MTRFFFLFLLGASFSLFSPTAMAQSSWDQLIQDVQTPSKGSPTPTRPQHPEAKPQTQKLSVPSGLATKRNPHPNGGDVSAKFVMQHRCHNPDIPQCLWDLRYEDYQYADLENCRDVTISYLDLVDSYQRCVSRVAENHAQRIVDLFNCAADGRNDCPTFYGDD